MIITHKHLAITHPPPIPTLTPAPQKREGRQQAHTDRKQSCQESDDR